MVSFAREKILCATVMGFALLMLYAPCVAYAADYDYIAADGRPFAATPTQEELDQIAILKANAENGIAPQTSSDSYFAFNLKDNTTAAADPATKDDDSSTYVYAKKKNVNYCQLYVDGFWGGTWHDCTYGMATLRTLGEYQIYQYVYENHRNQTGFSTSCPARLTAWRSNSGYWDDGYVCGLWSPDCVLYSNYPVLNP